MLRFFTFYPSQQKVLAPGNRVRVFGDVAVIHAENAWVMKDGRTGTARYTDVWRRQPDGRWLCIAAHITPVA